MAGRSRTPWSEVDLADVWRLYCEGLSPKAIAEATGQRHARVQHALVNMRKGRRPVPASVAGLTNLSAYDRRRARDMALRAEIWRRHCGGQSHAVIASELREAGMMNQHALKVVTSLIKRMRDGALTVPREVSDLMAPKLRRRAQVRAQGEAPAVRRLGRADRAHLDALLAAEPEREVREARQAALAAALARLGLAA